MFRDFSPFWVTMKRLPFFSVTSMRPSGRKARAQGSSNEVMDWTSNGRSICARAPAAIKKMLERISPFTNSRLAI